MLYGISFQIVIAIIPLGKKSANAVPSRIRSHSGIPNKRKLANEKPKTRLKSKIWKITTEAGLAQTLVVNQIINVENIGCQSLKVSCIT